MGLVGRAACGAMLLCAAAPCAVAAPCDGQLSRSDVVRCALSQNLDVRRARQELGVIAGRRIGAGLLLPANPVAAFTGGNRTSPDRPGNFFDWTASLSQEFEIAGQRRTRLRVVDGEAAAQIRRVAVAEHNTAAVALAAYFDVLAARETQALSTDLSAIAEGLRLFAEERVKANLMAPVDADVLIAETARVGELRLEAERRAADASAVLASLLGRTPSEPISISGTLDVADLRPPSQSLIELTERALSLRGEVAAAEADRGVAMAQIAALRRARVPNPTVRAYYQRDDFADQIIGGAIDLPLPLPGPLGHLNTGEIASARARSEQMDTTVEQVRRQVRREVVAADTAVRTRAAALTLYRPAQLARARGEIAALREGLMTRQLSVREAMLAQRSLIDLLQADIAARLAYAQAIVELYRVIGQPPFGGAQ